VSSSPDIVVENELLKVNSSKAHKIMFDNIEFCR